MVTGVRLGRSPGQIPAGRQGGALVSVLLGRVGAPKDPWRFPVELPQGPLCDAHPASSHLLPPLTIPAQLLFPDFAPEFIKLPGLSYTLPHLICLPHVGVVIPCVPARFPESSENIRCCFSSFHDQSTLLEPLHYTPFCTQAPF